jgi:hypothetical protein
VHPARSRLATGPMCSRLADPRFIALLAAAVFLPSCTFEARDAAGGAGAFTLGNADGVPLEPGSLQPFAYTPLDSRSFDLDRDGNLEHITLLATVERNERGELLWEEGHHWAVVLEDDGSRYTLFEQMVPHGRVELYTILEEPDRPVLLIETRSGMGCGGSEGSIGLSVDRFSFDTAQNGYVRDARIESSGRGVCRAAPNG